MRGGSAVPSSERAAEPDFWAEVDAIRERDTRYRREAYGFLVAALGAAVQAQPEERRADPVLRHLSGREVVESFAAMARREFGDLCDLVLSEWGVRSGEDIGHIVFQLVECGQLSARPEDTMEPFRIEPDPIRALFTDARRGTPDVTSAGGAAEHA
jgi:uncharacterized repeat protein (TIGR04138 family)